MAIIPTDTRLKVEIEIEDRWVEQDVRGYLGISSIGAKCPRSLWYSFRMCSKSKITPRLKRLFDRGHREEAAITQDLASIGIIHHSDQKEVEFCSGHGKGHCDGIVERVPDAPKTPHLVEYKTHNDKSFKDLKKRGFKASKPIHYDQMICYMDLLGLKRGLYIAVNKNDDARHYERISENPKRAEALFTRAMRIILSEIPPPKVGGADWFECKWCNHYYVCQMRDKPAITCRTCSASAVWDHGKWVCDRYDIELALGQQEIACKRYDLMAGLLSNR